MTPSPARAVLVLGMHRSGTSALAGLFDLLGPRVLGEMLPAMPEVNPGGFWEHAAIVRLHERVLAAMDSAWYDGRELPDRWWERPDMKDLGGELAEILRADFGGAPLWAVKDPRLCRLLPLWRPALAARAVIPHAALMLRDPREVAASLARRDGIQPELSHLLWLQYVRDSERWTRGWRRTVIVLDALLDDWEGATTGALAELRLPVPELTAEIRQRARAFLDPGLRHHTAAQAPAAAGLEALAVSCHEAAREGIGALERRLADVDAAVASTAREAAPWLGQLRGLLDARNQALDARNQALDASARAEDRLRREQQYVEVLQREIARVKATLSWRLTKPLRYAWSLVRRKV